MTRGGIEEVVAVLRGRYAVATKAEKGQILTQVCELTGFHRKAVVRLLQRPSRAGHGEQRRGRPRRYGPGVTAVLVQIWEALDRPCGKRLQPSLGEWATHLERHGELELEETTRGLLGELSASTIDRLLAAYRLRPVRQPRSFGPSAGGVRDEVELRTFGEWQAARPGEVQADLVMHCGTSLKGFHLTTLTSVDVATEWIVRQAVWGKGQTRVGGAVERVKRKLPVSLIALHSDNGSEFVNYGLIDWCRRGGVRFTRGRPYKKNDQAWVEQRNHTAVRQLVGYDRYSSRPAYEQLERVYAIADEYANFFQPVSKLVRKERHGAKVRKIYDIAQTPYQRMLASGLLDEATRTALDARYRSLNPAQLKRDLDAALRKLWALRETNASVTPFLTQQDAAVG